MEAALVDCTFLFVAFSFYRPFYIAGEAPPPRHPFKSYRCRAASVTGGRQYGNDCGITFEPRGGQEGTKGGQRESECHHRHLYLLPYTLLGGALD